MDPPEVLVLPIRQTWSWCIGMKDDMKADMACAEYWQLETEALQCQCDFLHIWHQQKHFPIIIRDWRMTLIFKTIEFWTFLCWCWITFFVFPHFFHHFNFNCVCCNQAINLCIISKLHEKKLIFNILYLENFWFWKNFGSFCFNFSFKNKNVLWFQCW